MICIELIDQSRYFWCGVPNGTELYGAVFGVRLQAHQKFFAYKGRILKSHKNGLTDMSRRTGLSTEKMDVTNWGHGWLKLEEVKRSLVTKTTRWHIDFRSYAFQWIAESIYPANGSSDIIRDIWFVRFPKVRCVDNRVKLSGKQILGCCRDSLERGWIRRDCDLVPRRDY